jgi:hypothetical protein
VIVCSGTPVVVNFHSSLPSTTYTWTASNGTSGSGNISSTIINNGTSANVGPLTSGGAGDSIILYIVVGTSPGGCTDTIHVKVIVKPVPALSASGFPTEICGGTIYSGTVTSSVPSAVISWTSNIRA